MDLWKRPNRVIFFGVWIFLSFTPNHNGYVAELDIDHHIFSPLFLLQGCLQESIPAKNRNILNIYIPECRLNLIYSILRFCNDREISILNVQERNSKELLPETLSSPKEEKAWNYLTVYGLIAAHLLVFLMLFWVISFWIKERRLKSGVRVCYQPADVREMEEKLSKNEKLFRHLVENMPVMMYAIHSSGMILYWNQECERVTGYRRDEVIGNPMGLALLKPEKDFFEKKEGFREGDGQCFRDKELAITCKNGNQRVISWSSISDFSPVPGIFNWGVGIDVTERKKSEDERSFLENKLFYLHKIESMGNLAGGIAHDFNNLLMGIMGNAELVRMETEDNALIHPYLDEIEQASKKAAELCGQMLAFSGKSHFILKTFDLNALIQGLEPQIQNTLPDNVKFIFYQRNEHIYIEGDSAQILQMIMNLLTNSFEAIGDKRGVVSVYTGIMEFDHDYLSETWLHESFTEGEYAYLEIADTGFGMKKEIIDKIFDPFFSTKFIGRGLGLPVVLGIVRSHKGTIKVYSEPEHGTAVKILFPLSQKQVTKIDHDSLQGWRGQGTIMVVDDDAAVRNVAVKMLQRAGFRAVDASGGSQAVEIYQKWKEDVVCILLDFSMPEMNGIQTFLELKKINPAVRCILSSGYNEMEFTQRLVMDGFSGFIQKPYQSQNLYQVLKDVLS